jgi:hypothetical protein
MTDQFYKVLFNKDEWTCFGANTYGITTYPASVKGIREDSEFFSINPLRPQSTRAGDNVVAYRNFLVEIDDYNDGSGVKKPVPPQQQLDWFNEIDLPFATLLWSGGKSYHAIISVDEGFTKKEYPNVVNAIFEVLSINNIPNDTSCKDLSRLSRAANSVRLNTKQIQEVKEVRRRISRKELEDWLAKWNVRIQVPVPPTPSTYTTGANDDISPLRKFDKAKEWSTNKNGIYSPNMTTGAHMWLICYGYTSYQVDMSLDQAIRFAEIEWGAKYISSSGGGLLSKVITKGWEFAKQKQMKQYKL